MKNTLFINITITVCKEERNYTVHFFLTTLTTTSASVVIITFINFYNYSNNLNREKRHFQEKNSMTSSLVLKKNLKKKIDLSSAFAHKKRISRVFFENLNVLVYSIHPCVTIVYMGNVDNRTVRIHATEIS